MNPRLIVLRARLTSLRIISTRLSIHIPVQSGLTIDIHVDEIILMEWTSWKRRRCWLEALTPIACESLTTGMNHILPSSGISVLLGASYMCGLQVLV